MTEFNLFGNASKDDIRVAYISTERGMVDNVTICEANDYAKLNPGTQFIFRTREFTKYMNINGVNKLTPDDLSPQQECEGIEITKECGPPKAHFGGGGGLGIKGNPIIGQDGAVLAVDLVSGGFGYQTPPIVHVKDNCGIGAGGNFKAELGEVAEQWEYYDLEEDFEDYEICEGASDTGVFGKRFGVNGEDLGVWEPKLYANFDKDPIAKEIKKYQDFFARGTNPFWSTRKDAPLQVTGERGTNRTVYNVDHPAWGDFMNKYAISPKPKSNVPGSDFAGVPYSFVWEEDFPYDGEYVFRGARDNKAELFLDGIFISNLDNFKGAVNPIKKTMEAGIHQIRIDLLNIPIKEKVIVQQSVEEDNQVAGVDFVKKAKGYYMIVGGNDEVEVSLQLYYNDKPDKAGLAISKLTIPNPNGNPLILEREKSGKTWKRTGSVSGKSIFKKNELGYGPIQFEDNVKDPILQKRNTAYGPNSIKYGELKFIDNHGDDTNAKLSIISAKNLQESTIKKSPPAKSTESQEVQITNVFNTVDYIDKANRPLWRTNVYNRGGFINQYGVCPFDTRVTLEDNPYAGTHTIIWNNVQFPIDGNYDIEIQVDDNVNLIIEGNGKKETIRKIGFAGDTDTSTGKSTYLRNFLKGTYKITAELEQIPGGKFGFDAVDNSVKGINPMALAVNIKTVFTETEVISVKSWNENPMGVSLSIDSPNPPIPQEEIPVAPGRCPRNPMWSTRYPNADQKWHPVQFDGWSPFFNRYALSPIPPKSEESSDSGGTVFTNSWQQEIPYNGWYKLVAEVDDIGRIYMNGELKLDLSRRNEKIKGESKFFLSKGTTEIKVEVENYESETFKKIDQKIFSTADWAVQQVKSRQTGNVDVTFTTTSSAQYANSIKIDGILEEAKTYKGAQINKTITKSVELDKVYKVSLTSAQSKRGVRLRAVDGSILQMEEATDNDWTDIQCSVTQGKFYDFVNGANAATCKFKVEGELLATEGLGGGTAKDGVTYEGAELATYTSNELGANLSPVWLDDEDFRANCMGKTWTGIWKNVNFPEDGRYEIKAIADDLLTVKLDGHEIVTAQVGGKYRVIEAGGLTTQFSSINTLTFNATKGKRELSFTINNIPGREKDTFQTNPVHFGFKITKKMTVKAGETKSWTQNPIGLSAVLVPPPCPKKISGKGTVTRIVVDDPGNGFPRPQGDGYPVGLGLTAIDIKDAGINYDCSKDKLVIDPSNGAKASLVCDNFGRIAKVVVDDPGLGFTEWPQLRIDSPTGVNFEATPVFEVIRDPIVIDQDKLLQVTDLVGVKQTGYYEGRPYYGAVFYKDNVRYAGWYETPGQLVQIYDTLQESIDAEVTTPPSAILRSGSDVSSNDPKLNLPGTPENLT